MGSSKASYGGNISEINWRHLAPGDTSSSQPEHTYAFTYDALSQLTDTRHFTDGIETDRFTEKGLKYDLNGNIESLNRFGCDSVSAYRYTYDGNKLLKVTKNTATTLPAENSLLSDGAEYRYDALGNMTYDGLRNIEVTYNLANLPEKISRNGVTLANYRYLSDGTKLSVTDAEGNGYEYLGSLVYKRIGNTLQLESTPFAMGRLVATQAEQQHMTPYYFITDHLGSTRVVVDSCGVVKERNDYFPYGMRWEDPDRIISDNRYLFNGNEAQIVGKTGWIDYGARMYDPQIGRCTTQDPLSELFFAISPYGYVRNNPINKIDPTGMRDEDDEEQQNPKPEAEKNIDIESVTINGYSNSPSAQEHFNNAMENMPGGSLWRANEDLKQGNYLSYAINVIFGIADIAMAGKTMGATSVAKASLKNSVKAATKATAKSSAKKAVNYTKNNFRKNVLKLANESGVGKQAHHVLPQKYSDKFTKARINIHDPKYGVLLDNHFHLQKAKEYNVQWSSFFKGNRNPTKTAIHNEADQIMNNVYKK